MTRGDTTPGEATRAVESREAGQAHEPGRAATPEAAVAGAHPVDPAVAAHERGMNERGAAHQGEGRIT